MMSWTKRQIAIESLLELGIASYEYDLSADEISSAVRRMDMLVASWGVMSRRIGYPLPESPELTDAAAETNIPDWAALALVSNLALSLAPQYGKNISIETRRTAQESLNGLYSYSAIPAGRETFPGMPLGAGNKTHISGGATFVPEAGESITDIHGNPIEGL